MKLTAIGALSALALAGAVGMGAWQKPDTKNAHAKSNAPPLIASIQGPALFHAYCASCHGVDAKGAGGPMATSLRVKPADLTLISARNGGVFPKARIERIISGEEQPASGHGSSTMPVWGPIFSHVDSDRHSGPVRLAPLTPYRIRLQHNPPPLH